MVVRAIADAGGSMHMDLLAIDAAEAAWFTEHLKGRRGAKTIGILHGSPGDEVSVMDRLERGLPMPVAGKVQVSKSTAIATKAAKPVAPKQPWDEEGY